MESVFLAVYTNEVKRYCDEEFFMNLKSLLSGNVYLCVVDNSVNLEYMERLKQITERYDIECELIHVDVNHSKTFFQDSVTKSVEHLRRLFIESGMDYFVIVESDVIPPAGSLNKLVNIANKETEYGAIGGIYYSGIHSFDGLDKLVEEDCVFSGFTLYRRRALVWTPFRWDYKNPNCFPDSNMKYDLKRVGWKVGNYHGIICKHLK